MAPIGSAPAPISKKVIGDSLYFLLYWARSKTMILVELPIALQVPPIIVAIAMGNKKALTGRSFVRHQPSTIGIIRLTTAVLLTKTAKINTVSRSLRRPKKSDFEVPMITLSKRSSTLVSLSPADTIEINTTVRTPLLPNPATAASNERHPVIRYKKSITSKVASGGISSTMRTIPMIIRSTVK